MLRKRAATALGASCNDPADAAFLGSRDISGYPSSLSSTPQLPLPPSSINLTFEQRHVGSGLRTPPLLASSNASPTSLSMRAPLKVQLPIRGNRDSNDLPPTLLGQLTPRALQALDCDCSIKMPGLSPYRGAELGGKPGHPHTPAASSSWSQQPARGEAVFRSKKERRTGRDISRATDATDVEDRWGHENGTPHSEAVIAYNADFSPNSRSISAQACEATSILGGWALSASWLLGEAIVTSAGKLSNVAARSVLESARSADVAVNAYLDELRTDLRRKVMIDESPSQEDPDRGAAGSSSEAVAGCTSHVLPSTSPLQHPRNPQVPHRAHSGCFSQANRWQPDVNGHLQILARSFVDMQHQGHGPGFHPPTVQASHAVTHTLGSQLQTPPNSHRAPLQQPNLLPSKINGDSGSGIFNQASGIAGSRSGIQPHVYSGTTQPGQVPRVGTLPSRSSFGIQRNPMLLPRHL